ncbi:hypothetical protein LCGC14_2489970, partial [marine sediment metagenome]
MQQVLSYSSGAVNSAAQYLQLADNASPQSLLSLNSTTISIPLFDVPTTNSIGLAIEASTAFNPVVTTDLVFVTDFFSFGFSDDGVQAAERVSNQIIRIELEETGDNTSTFEGSLEYVMVNQLNILDESTYTGLSPIADDPSFIVIEDLTDEDAPRVNYLDLGADGVSTQIADQEEAPSHSGVVSFDLSTYKIADTVVITLQDNDLNVDSDVIDIFTVVQSPGGDAAIDTIGSSGLPTLSFGALGRMLDVTFDDALWTDDIGTTSGSITDACNAVLNATSADTSLGATGFTLVETDIASGIFTGDWQIPTIWCRSNGIATTTETTTGLDLEVNYVDFRDASGEIIEVGDSAGIRANTGSISLDRTVYPVPFGTPADFGNPTATSPKGFSIFGIHASGINTGETISTTGNSIRGGDLIIHIRVNDPDFDISASGEDKIAANTAAAPTGPVKITVIRGSNTIVLGYA